MAKKNLAPGYFHEKPLFKTVSRLRKTIGLQDSSIQTNQLAVLMLEDEYNSSTDKEVYFKELFHKYKISRGTLDFEQFKKLQYKSYILQTYNLIEPLLKSINSEYRHFNFFQKEWKTKDGDKELDPFNQLLANLPDGKAKIIKEYPEYYLFNYYRLIRNAIVHLQENKDTHKKTTKYYKDQIEVHLEHFTSNYKIDAPNTPADINFQDFMLYTRAIKYFSNILNDVCFPELNDLVEVAFTDENLQSKLLQTRFLNFEGALLKRINTLRGFFKTNFNYSPKETVNEFCRLYLEREKTDYSEYL